MIALRRIPCRDFVVATTIAVWTLLIATTAAIASHPIIPGYERFHSDNDSATTTGGYLLFGELNCTACHAAEGWAATGLLTRQAPILDDVGSRVRPEFVRAFLADPQSTKPGTTMPSLFANTAPTKRAEQVEALVHFLASTGQLLEVGPITPAVSRGEALFHRVGCVACHDARRDGSAKLTTSVPLPTVMETKYSIPGLTKFLKNPLHVRPSGRMPQLNLSDDEARDIASYLLKNLEAEGVIEFAYYEGNWQELPEFSKLKPIASGKTASFDVNLGQPNNFGIVFKARFRIAREGKYRFFLGSDDGSRLKIDGEQVADSDGVHPLSFKSGDVDLIVGTHQFEVEYFESGGEQELRVEFEGPGVKRQTLEYALVSPERKPADKQPFVVDAELATRGQHLFGTLGCASCHQLRVDDKKIVSSSSAKPLASLDISKGCLSQAITASPQFSLNDRQRIALQEWLNILRILPHIDLAFSPEKTIASTLATFNCYACHQRGERGGVETTRNDYFKSDQPEMGDEGRIPPHLTGVGAKLQPTWLKQVFDNGAKDRPYMFTRMPRFGSQNVGHLVGAFGQADPDVAAESFESDIDHRRMKVAGRKLVGSQGFSCIKCHTWGDVPATGIQSINMVTITQRLKENWFQRYLLNPQQYRPGTRMPAAWPQGQVLLPTLLDGKAETQIQAIWEYLRDGDKAAMPVGLGKNPIVLMPFDEPLIYRNFIEGAGPRAIGVGYPEHVNQAFDANNLRIALLWHGAFMDASRHWLGRGTGFQPPLGDNILKLPEGVSFAVLNDSTTPWPAETAKQLGYQFRGYRMDKARRPTFLYQVSGIHIEDTLVPTSEEEFTTVRRTFTLSGDPLDNLWYRAATGKSIELQDDGVALVDGVMRVRINGGKLRKSGENVELLVPVQFMEGKATIVQEYEW